MCTWVSNQKKITLFRYLKKSAIHNTFLKSFPLLQAYSEGVLLLSKCSLFNRDHQAYFLSSSLRILGASTVGGVGTESGVSAAATQLWPSLALRRKILVRATQPAPHGCGHTLIKTRAQHNRLKTFLVCFNILWIDRGDFYCAHPTSMCKTQKSIKRLFVCLCKKCALSRGDVARFIVT